MSIQTFKISRTYPVHQYENYLEQTSDLIQTIPQIDNVKYWGAKGNGINDDSQAFQDAVDNNAHVYVPTGGYLIVTPIVLNANQTLIGNNRGLSSLFMNDTNTAQIIISIIGGPSVVQNLTFAYIGTNFTTSTYISITDTSYWVIDNCRTNLGDANTAHFVRITGTTADCAYGRITNNTVRSMVSCINATAVGGANILRQLIITNNNFQISPLFAPVLVCTFTNCQDSIITNNTLGSSFDSFTVTLGIQLITCTGMIFNNNFDLVTTKYTYLNGNTFQDDENSGINLITDLATTFSVENRSTFQVVNTAPTNLANITGGYTGKRIFVMLNANTTVVTTGPGNIRGNGGVNYAAAAGDGMTATFNGTNWLATFIDVAP